MNFLVNHLRPLSLAALLACILLTGCGSQEISIPDSEYGKLIGSKAGTSLNSTRVFGELLRSRGHKVRHQSKISPRLNRYDTIVWMPNRDRPPSTKAVIWLEDWLSEDDRTLIFVGRGYDADVDYWTQMVSMTSGSEQEKARRHRAEAMVSTNRQSTAFDFESDVDGLWYDAEANDSATATEISGPWAAGIDVTKTTLDTRVLLSPPTTLNDADIVEEHEFTMWGFRSFELDSKVLLEVDGKPFAFQIDAYDVDSELVVISNASFLLNYPLLTPENQKLAMRVAERCSGDVAFLETGPWAASVRTGNEAHSDWAWISKKPMNYLVPHLLFWGILFCFAYFPIFGHPRRLNFSPEKKFKNHVNAVGDMLKKTGDQAWAENKIAEFQKAAGRKKK